MSMEGAEMNLDLTNAIMEIAREVERAQAKHRPMQGPHEGYAVILEELDELWNEVKANRLDLARKEAVQVAAMAVRFLIDLKIPISPLAEIASAIEAGTFPQK